MRTHRLQWQLALGQVVSAIALLFIGTVLLAQRYDNVRVAEAAVATAHDAEVLAGQVGPRLGAGQSLDDLVTSSDGRRIEVTDVRGAHLAGERLTSDPVLGSAVLEAIGSLDPSDTPNALTLGGRVLGVQPILLGGELIGTAIVSEPAPLRRGWRQLFGLDWRAAVVLACASGGLGWWLAGRITWPLRRLTEHARSLLLSGATEPSHPTRITEVAVLGSTLELVGHRMIAEAQRGDRLELDLRRLSHELRTPLTTIRLRLDDPAALDDHALRVIDGQLDRMDRLAEQLSQLRHARPESEELELGSVLRAAVERLRPIAEWGRVDLRLTTPHPMKVVAERDALEDAISNVVENAIKYSTRGSQVVARTVQEGDWCVIEVRDRGPGIPAEHRDVILRPGVRLVGSSKVRGTGQGLAIVVATMDRHGGRLEMADAPGGGALLRLVLPATDG